jgi:CDP-diacylglycerol--glycerol-3-phosphate 3-phosphatidyltransferase
MISQINALVGCDSLVIARRGERFDVIASLVVLGIAVSISAAYRLSFGRRRSPSFSRLQNVQGGVLLSKPLMNAGYWVLQPVGMALCRLGVPPDTITWFGLVLALCAGVAVIAGYPGIAGFVLLCSVLCDVLDGMVARLSHRQSASGAVFDAISDRLEEIVIFGSIAVATRYSTVMVSLCVLSLVAALMNSYVSAKAEANRVTIPSGRMRRGERSAWVIAGLVASPLLALVAFPWQVRLPAIAMVTCLVTISIGTSISATKRAFALVKRLRSATENITTSNDSAPAAAEPTAPDSANVDLASWLREPHKHIRDFLAGTLRVRLKAR